MKFISLILSLGILFLSCITCEDLPVFEKLSNSVDASVNISKPCTENATDNCTPLCICNCCGQPVLNLKSVSSQPLVKVNAITKKSFVYKNSFTSYYIQKIWQPPKLNNLIG
ncbi:hypothetical protein EZJ43_05160 [Pedobacter changchengzhani]|uniref:Uncharacterized protein n=1 Tax=Pedobacter changchengzhani TaxID=2529274 RepID=A0A4R5MN03_9SPHI|nr:DUF6660 family protein [Pedobacter changchengzhani]TDG36675.1 hypothetical protein EZJ43_05160 [Pedobacter changchengzhani]